MVSFYQSNAAIMAALLASAATTDAAYGRHSCLGSRPSRALGSRTMLPTRRSGGRPSILSQDIQRVMNDFDVMFDAVLGGADDMLFYEPFQLQRMSSRPSYLLQGPAQTLNALAAAGKAKHNTFGITQDETQLQIVVAVPGATANDISLQLEGDGTLLRISGETKREEGGISVHSRFDRAFTLNPDVDTSKISAQIDNGVLSITAPKYQEAKETVHKIDIVENKKIGSGEAAELKEVVASASHERTEESTDAEPDVAASQEKEESKVAKPEVDESVIDLDEAKE